MTPAPSSRSKRSSTLTNIPPPLGPPPPPPQSGYPNSHSRGHGHSYSTTSQSSHSSYSSQSGQHNINAAGQLVYPVSSSSFEPPRPSFSSSRASPVGRMRSGRERERDHDSRDSEWRSTFDAALVKAQQAVQLDELKETALAANLYAQAANDLGRVIPMCSSEKKKQSMLAIQAIYLDRVTQLREAMSSKPAGVPVASSSYSVSSVDSQGYDYGHHYSTSNGHGIAYEDEYQQYSHQQYHPQGYQPTSQHQQRYSQSRVSQQYQPSPYQQLPAPINPQQQQQYRSPPVEQPEPQVQNQQEKGFRLFGKKRSKTQSSAPQPPEIAQNYHHDQEYSSNFNSQRASTTSQIPNNGSTPYRITTAEGFTIPYVAPPRTPSPSPIVSPIFMTDFPEHKKVSSSTQKQTEQSVKSSKWKPFSKKKSKSVSVSDDTNHHDSHRESTQMVAALSPTIKPASVQHMVNPANSADAYPHQKQDWYVEDVPSDELDDELQYEDRYYDEDDEDIDPYYIADTKGRAQAPTSQQQELQSKSHDISKQNTSILPQEKTLSPEPAYAQETSLPPPQDNQDLQSEPLADEKLYTSNYTDDGDDESVYHNVPGSSFIKQHEEYQPEKEEYQQEEGEYQQEEEEYQQEKEEYHEQGLEGQELEQDQMEEEHSNHYEQWQDPQHRQIYLETNEVYVEEEEEAQAFYEAVDHDHTLPVSSPISEQLPEIKPEPEPESEKTKTKRTWFGKKKKDKNDKKQKEKDIKIGTEHEHIDDVARLMEEALFGSSTPPKPSKPVLKEKTSSGSVPQSVSNSDDKREEPQVIPEAITAENELVISAEPGSATKEETSEPINAQKHKKSRSLSIFKSKKKKDIETQPQEEELGSPLSPTVTNDDTKSIQSHHTRQSSKSDSRHATEMAAALAIKAKEKKDSEKEKEKEAKGKDSDEYVPYEYQEELEGPLMERVEVKEDREIIGFVMPIEEIKDYTMADHEEAALDNWDSWVSQLESFEQVLSDKGLKKEKMKKKKKVKEPKEEKEEKDDMISPLGSVKANRSGIFGLGRSDTVRSRSSTILDLPSTAYDSRPLSMSTTLMDDTSIAPRPSFQSSRSGGSEAPSQFTITPIKKRWWSTKRRDSSSMYRISTTLSMADLEQDKHLSSLLQVRSSENLTLDTQLVSMPIVLNEPSTPAPELSKEAPAAMETVLNNEEEKKVEVKKTEQEDEKQEAQEQEDDEPIAPLPKIKAKAKSSKPKLLPISTPLAQLLEMDNADELWQYVQQAKTYATTRMNKGDKRSAAIALKRAQALEARWQEILLEMESSDENTDDLLEDDDEDEESEEEEEEEEVVVVPAKKEKKEVVQAVVTSPTSTPAPVKTITIVNNTPNTHNDIEEEEEDDDDEESYAAQRRRSLVSRSSSTPDKYSKYKVNKAPVSGLSSVSTSLTIVAEEETNENGELAVDGKVSESLDGVLGPDATLEQMLESSNTDHLAFYIQRMKTDTVAKARSGSKFAALESMKNVKILQQRLDDLLEGNDKDAEEQAEAAKEE
ncbi:hypothetical protein BGZ46_008867 [Entomortierella lignicola]|nr:hypothetical protein BGZ46_008867 [Entomortierella lignicola]